MHINIEKIKRKNFSRLIRQVESGKTLIICIAGKSLAKLEPIENPSDFDDHSPDEVLEPFEN
jgi:antitoxin (DNA-binding transcriptional repressor) of toxin-antitoxin stability system